MGQLKHVAMVVRDDGYDRLLTPLTFALVLAKRGVQVDILFTLWAVKVLTLKGQRALKVSGTHEEEEPWLRQQVALAKMPSEIGDLLGLLRETGQVSLYGCAIAARVLGVEERDLVPAANGIIHPVTFLEERALGADLCPYF